MIPVIGLIIASAMIISCENVNGPGGLSAENAAPALSASRAKVGDAIPITSEEELALIGVDPAYPADGEYELATSLFLWDWIPICDPTNNEQPPFTGTFDGKGNDIFIDGFHPDAVSGGKYLGIFAVIGGNEGAPSVSNLVVYIYPAPFTTSAQYVGGVAGYARDADFSNIEVYGDINATQYPNTPNNFNVGGVTGFAASSTFFNIFTDIYFGAVRTVTTAPKWEIWRGGDTFQVRAVNALGETVTGEDGLAIGGVAGAVKFSQFRDITVFGRIEAAGQTQGTPVYAGGVLGYANGATMDNGQSDVEIIVNGPGYNTSGGGIAGYVINTTVRDSYAGGAITVRGESVDFGDYYSWQVYAGGLVGYAGGANIGASLIDHSHADGVISAYAPYPYAGGLLGYLYGYNNFQDPAKNGGTVSRSYATGAVRASVQPDTAHNIADIPYAGGLVGYSSVTGSTIADSYATGSVTATTEGAYAWAGGIVGGNANNAVVLRVYATGNVTSATGSFEPLYPPYPPDSASAGPAAGGIAGFNYYTANTLVSHSVALNESVYGNNTAGQNVVHRVAGSLGNGAYTGTLDDNYASFAMLVGAVWQKDIGFDNADGEDMTPRPPQSLYAGLGWDFSGVWQMTGNYPTLR
jgi:hypothetical protein